MINRKQRSSTESKSRVISKEEEIDNLYGEVGMLRRTVESKMAAVNILRFELEECQKERDKFRGIAEQVPLSSSRNTSLTKPTTSPDISSAFVGCTENSLAQLLSQSKEDNRQLRLTESQLRCRLHDAHADLKVLREERSHRSDHLQVCLPASTSSQLAQREREAFVQQMETLSMKKKELEGDLRRLLEEREQMCEETEILKQKLHRLNHILNTILNSNKYSQSKRTVDLDAILSENRYLRQRLNQCEEEKSLAKLTASKYKTALEKCQSNATTIKKGFAESYILTPKKVEELLKEYKREVGVGEERDLQCLCVALVDALAQRSKAVKTHRAANKVLSSHICELERRIENLIGINQVSVDASDCLLVGYVHPSGPLPKYSEEVLDSPEVKALTLSMDNQENSANHEINLEIQNEIDESQSKSPINICIPRDEIQNNCEMGKSVEIEESKAGHYEDPSSNPVNTLSHTHAVLPIKLDTRESFPDASITTEAATMHSAIENTYNGDADEDIIPLELLDTYIKELTKKQRLQKKQDTKNTNDYSNISTATHGNCHESNPALKVDVNELQNNKNNNAESRSFVVNSELSTRDSTEHANSTKVSLKQTSKEDEERISNIEQNIPKKEQIKDTSNTSVNSVKMNIKLPSINNIESQWKKLDAECDVSNEVELKSENTSTEGLPLGDELVLDWSDYDSDDANFEAMLQDWKSQVHKSPQKEGKKKGVRFWKRKGSNQNDEEFDEDLMRMLK